MISGLSAEISNEVISFALFLVERHHEGTHSRRFALKMQAAKAVGVNLCIMVRLHEAANGNKMEVYSKEGVRYTPGATGAPNTT